MKFVFLPTAVPKVLHWGLDAVLLLYFTHAMLMKRLPQWQVRQWWFLLAFIGIVLLSMVTAQFVHSQNFGQSFRVIYMWMEYIFVFVWAKRSFRENNLFIAMGIWTIFHFCLWLFTYITGIYLFDTMVSEGDYEEAARGIARIKVPGGSICSLWGLWSLGLYLSSRKARYLLPFFMFVLLTVLAVSRQHIVVMIAVSALLYFREVRWYKKALFIFSYVVALSVLPHLKVFQAMSELTENQMEKNDNMRDDIRVNAAVYYVFAYQQSNYTRLMGNCKYHANSPYGRSIARVIMLYGFVLSDIGFVGIYIYFGIVGLLLVFYMLYWAWRQHVPLAYKGIQYYIYLVFLGNIMSHSLDTSTLPVAIALFMISPFYQNYISKPKLRLS